ncbi:MAG: hypothetical protein RR582_11775 [Niameybacter sp.]
MFDELTSKVKQGGRLRISKGTVHLSAGIESVEEYVEEGCYKELRLKLTGGSVVYIYDCYTITKTRRPNDLINQFEWCYRVVDEEDAVFYITSN